MLARFRARDRALAMPKTQERAAQTLQLACRRHARAVVEGRAGASRGGHPLPDAARLRAGSMSTRQTVGRARHVPTGLATVSQDQRSQFASKEIALLKLACCSKTHAKRTRPVASARCGTRTANWNAVLTYEGERFRKR